MSERSERISVTAPSRSVDRAQRGSAMSEAVYVELLSLASGIVLLTAVLVLWRRELAAMIRVFAVQGVALAGLVAVVAVHEASAELGVVAVGVLALRAGVLPYLLRRALSRRRAATAGDPATGQRGRLSAGRRGADPAGARGLRAAGRSRSLAGHAAIPVGDGSGSDRVLRAGHPPPRAVAAGRLPADGQRHHRRRVPHHRRDRAGRRARSVPGHAAGGAGAAACSPGWMRAAFGDTDLDELRELHD